MATPRRRATHVVLAFFAALLLLPLVGAGVGEAAPRNITKARQELDALNEQVEAAVEDYNYARLELAGASRKAAAAQAKVTRASAGMQKAQRQLRGLMTAAYIYGGTDEIVQLVTSSSPQTFLDQATALDQVARGREDQIRNLQVQRRVLAAAQSDAKSVVANRRSIERQLNAVRSSILRQMRRQEQLVTQLETADARAKRLARLAQQRRTLRGSRDSGRIPAYNGPISGRAAAALREAERQLGKPYKWGAAGPNSFDCSGLTMWAWGHAGVSLPHSSRAQYNEGVRVSRNELRPGDLVFFGNPIHHVGIYVGGNRYIAAPQTGEYVSYRSMGRGGYAGAVRL